MDYTKPASFSAAIFMRMNIKQKKKENENSFKLKKAYKNGFLKQTTAKLLFLTFKFFIQHELMLFSTFLRIWVLTMRSTVVGILKGATPPAEVKVFEQKQTPKVPYANPISI